MTFFRGVGLTHLRLSAYTNILHTAYMRTNGQTVQVDEGVDCSSNTGYPRLQPAEIATLAALEAEVADSGQSAGFAGDPILSAARTSVVVPALNEAANLAYLFERMPSGVFEVILVDGHSTDGTVEVAKELWPGVRIVHQRGAGKGDALVRGARVATGDIIVLLDADGSTDPAEIPRFVAALLAGADFAKGTRFGEGGGSADITPLRRLGNALLSKAVNKMWGLDFSDLCYGYNAFWTRCIDDVLPHCNGFEVETLINIRAATTNKRIVEVPSFEAERLHGTSNLRVRRDGMRVLRTIFAERIRAV